VNFGVIFGSGPTGLREFARDAYGLEMTLDEAQAVIDGFLRTYPAVARWQQRQAEKAKRNNAVSTVGGRVYRFSWEPGQKYARNLALNLPVQGTAAEIAVEATIRISNRLQKELPGQAQLVLQVHDEFVVEADEREEVVIPTRGLADSLGLPKSSRVRIDGGEGEIRHATGAYTSRRL